MCSSDLTADAESGTTSTAQPWDAILAEEPGDGVSDDLKRSRPLVALAFFILLRVLGWLCRIVLRLRVSGVEHVPARGPYLICPNHQSYLDAFLVLSVLPFRVFRQLFFVGASEYFETALMKAIARAGNVIPVDSNTNLINAMQAGSTGLREGKVLMIFPEGERSIDGQLKPFRKGTAILSAHLEAPVVPVALSGLYELWPRSRGIQWSALLPWKSAPVRVTFGDPIEMSPGDDTANTATLRAAMEQLLARR